ncbi:unnamed protein product, partial [Ectocarpus fasciculatus]
MPEWTGVNKNVGGIDVSPPSSPESSISVEPRGLPPPPLPSGAAPAEAPPAAPVAAAAAESGPPSPPSISAPAPPPPPPVSQAARQPSLSQSRRPSLTVRPPSYGDLTSAADPQTGPEPSPAGSVVPAREEKSLPAPALEEQPPLPPPRPPKPETKETGSKAAAPAEEEKSQKPAAPVQEIQPPQPQPDSLQQNLQQAGPRTAVKTWGKKAGGSGAKAAAPAAAQSTPQRPSRPGAAAA